MLITMVPRDKPQTSTDIDRIVSAEILDKETNPEFISHCHITHDSWPMWTMES